MKTILRLLGAGFFLLPSFFSFATHNRAGEIIIEQLPMDCGSNMVRCTIITYTKSSSINADRDSLTISWGDSTFEEAVRFNGPGIPPQGDEKENDIKYNYYIATHIYPGPGRYTVSMTDPNRNGGIINVNPPGSENVQFHLQTTFTLMNSQFQGCNSTPRLLQPPIDYACVGQPFVHNPNAYDPDGDSLTYDLVVPMQGVDTPVPNFIFPQDVNGNNGCCLSLFHLTGTLEWITPMVPGEYNVAMIIVSWRNGVPIDTTLRDMQIIVFADCEGNHAPQIETYDQICVVAGDVVEFNVTATDPDPGDKIRLTALGGPFIVPLSKAEDVEDWRPEPTPAAFYQTQPVIKTFRWQTVCEHISDQPYTVVFKATDDYFLGDTLTGLSTLKTTNIKVVGPPPADVQAAPSSDRIDISWAKPYACEAAADDYFFGFSVWRREGSNPFPMDTCTPGLTGKGYTWIGNTLNEFNGRYQFTDSDVERGRTYCYRVLARFAKRTNSGQPFNFVESLPSQEVCIQLNRDVPLITHVTVLETAIANGQILVKWAKPIAEDLDTLLNLPPYRYELQRARGINGVDYNTVATYTSNTFWQLSQTQFLDTAPDLDSKNSPHHYRIQFYVNNESAPIGEGTAASSVFLEITPTDNTNILHWKFDVPWVNSKYSVWRFNNATASWDSIGITQDTFYRDEHLLNGREYCYYVESFGSYGVTGIVSPLLNRSQEACAAPADNVPPCPPSLVVRNICNENLKCQDAEALNNRLSWVNPMNLCPETDDVVSYKLYYAAVEEAPLVLIASIDQAGDTTFLHEPERGIAGCYAVTALDTFANESALSNIVCVDNCPNYSLPNTFTPNEDGRNDIYVPYAYCFIESIELQVFNRWGELVFKTKDPNINWAGENLKGKLLAAGTYFYHCQVYEQRVSGTVPAPEVLNGYIDLIR